MYFSLVMPRGIVFDFFSASHCAEQNFLASAFDAASAGAGKARGLRLIETNASQTAVRFIVLSLSLTDPRPRPAAFLESRATNSKPSFEAWQHWRRSQLPRLT